MIEKEPGQKVHVPLHGVLELLSEIRRVEEMIRNPLYTRDQRAAWRNRIDGLKYAVQVLTLPIAFRPEPRVA